jgi:p-hydroxybenzoate 3-monooxygenase
VDCLVLETETREFIEQRPRAGFIEEWAVRGLEQRGLARRLLEHAPTHTECEFRVGGARQRFRYTELTGQRHFVYPQPLLVTDLVREYADVHGGAVRFGVRDVRLHDTGTDHPSVSYVCPATGERQVVHCDFVAGCDGARGMTRTVLPPERTARHDYGIAVAVRRLPRGVVRRPVPRGHHTGPAAPHPRLPRRRRPSPSSTSARTPTTDPRQAPPPCAS